MAFGSSNTGSKFDDQFFKKHIQGAGIGHSPTFQASGFPWITGSQVDPSGSWVKVEFPHVSRGLKVRNTDRYYLTEGQESGSAPLSVFFSNGTDPTQTPPQQVQDNHAYTLADAGEEERFEWRTDHIYVVNMSGFGSSTKKTGSFQVYVERTGVEAQQMIQLTGSGIDE